MNITVYLGAFEGKECGSLECGLVRAEMRWYMADQNPD